MLSDSECLKSAAVRRSPATCSKQTRKKLRIRLVFDDTEDPTYAGGEYEGLIKLGKASVYFSWSVEVKQDKRKMNEIRKQKEAEKRLPRKLPPLRKTKPWKKRKSLLKPPVDRSRPLLKTWKMTES